MTAVGTATSHPCPSPELPNLVSSLSLLSLLSHLGYVADLKGDEAWGGDLTLILKALWLQSLNSLSANPDRNC